MSDLEKKVEESRHWKRDADYCSNRIGISKEKYLKIKSQIKKKKKLLRGKNNANISVNVEKGEAKFEGRSNTEPRDANEIIKLLKIDTSKWKLSQYWNKQMSDHWRVSALVTQIKSDDVLNIQELIKNWKPKKYKIPKLYKNQSYSIESKEKVCGIMSLQDIHFGKEGNDTIDADFEEAVKYLISKAIVNYDIERLYFVVGGDLINMDTFGGTTTSGTPLDNCMTATEAYMQAFDAMHWAINVLVSYVENLTIIYVPGNHDRLSSFHLVHALSKSIGDHPNIEWDIEYSERKVHTWHKNFNAFEHGDATSKNTPIIYATEFPLEWGQCKNRTLFTGHFHQNRKVEYITTAETAGFIHKTLPSLSKTDYWHYHKKFVGNRRSGKIELQSPEKGNICELTYLAD